MTEQWSTERPEQVGRTQYEYREAPMHRWDREDRDWQYEETATYRAPSAAYDMTRQHTLYTKRGYRDNEGPLSDPAYQHQAPMTPPKAAPATPPKAPPPQPKQPSYPPPSHLTQGESDQSTSVSPWAGWEDRSSSGRERRSQSTQSHARGSASQEGSVPAGTTARTQWWSSDDRSRTGKGQGRDAQSQPPPYQRQWWQSWSQSWDWN